MTKNTKGIGVAATSALGTLALALGGLAHADGFTHPASGTPYPEMMEGLAELAIISGDDAGVVEGYGIKPAFTVGEHVDGYTPPGILDGLGAFRRNSLGKGSYYGYGHDRDDDDDRNGEGPRHKVVRILANHELNAEDGYAYRLRNGVELTGARVSYFDFDAETRQLLDAGLAYDTIYDRAGKRVRHPSQINELDPADPNADSYGLDRFCSAAGYEAGHYGFRDNIFFTNEETSRPSHPHGGTIWAIDVQRGDLWALSELGRGAWENVTALDTPSGDRRRGQVALLLGDDYGSDPGDDVNEDGREDKPGAPLYLWVGKKKPRGNFVDQNGLADGQLYVWVADSARSPEDFSGTGMSMSGRFEPIAVRDPAKAGMPGYDDAGYKDDITLRQEALEDAANGGLEAFAFSRPEDLHTNPANGQQIVFASTGRGGVFPSDVWGTTYVVDVEWQTDTRGRITGATADVTILYDGDDSGGGQFPNPYDGLRSPDNLVWATDSYIYIQEDRATDWTGSTRETSIWRLDPAVEGGAALRVAEMDRTAIAPPGVTDTDSDDLGDWESSGIIDVTELFDTLPGETLMIGTVQAHSLRTGIIANAINADDDRGTSLVEGGQLFFMNDYNRIEESE